MASQLGCPRKESGNRQGGWISAQAPVLPLRSMEGREKVAGRHTGHPVPRAAAAMGHQDLPSGDTWPLGACPRLRLIFRAHLHGGWSTLGRAGCSPLTKRNLAQSSYPRPCRHATFPSSGLHTGKQPARTSAALGVNCPYHAGKASSGLSAGPSPPSKEGLSLHPPPPPDPQLGGRSTPVSASPHPWRNRTKKGNEKAGQGRVGGGSRCLWPACRDAP